MIFKFKHLNTRCVFRCKSQKNNKIRNMKTKITISIASHLLGVIIASAQPTITSYASTQPALEASLSGLDNQCEVPDTDVTSVNRVAFASRIDFPAGTTSATINSANFTLIKKTAGNQVTQLPNVSMGGGAWSNEGGTGRPALFARDHSSAMVAMSGTFAGTLIPNAKSVFITDQKFDLGFGPFDKMIQEGDFYKLTRTINVSWTVSGVPLSTTLTTESIVVIWFFPTAEPKITSTTTSEGQISFNVIGVTPGSNGQTWWMETSTDLGISDPWVVSTGGVVSGNTIISFPTSSEEDRRFWRVKFTKNPSMP